jgi:hypothetical protein
MVTAPSSRNRTGVYQTIDAVRNAKEFKLISKMDSNDTPGVAGFIANFGTTPDKYSDAAANWFRDRDICKAEILNGQSLVSLKTFLRIEKSA